MEKTKDSTDFIIKIVNPERLSFEKPNKFLSTCLTPDKRFPHPIDRTLSMFQSWYRVSNQLEEHKKSNNLDKVVELGATINPETLLGFYLHNFLKIRVEKVQMDIKLFRVSYLKFSKY